MQRELLLPKHTDFDALPKGVGQAQLGQAYRRV